MINSSRSERKKKLVILCSSYFDRLGHPIFANKIKNELNDQYDGEIEIRGIDTYNNGFSLNKSSNTISMPVIGGSLHNIDTRSALKKRYGKLGSLFILFIRFISITHFYWQNFRMLDNSGRVIDLECEPIQAALASVFASIHPDIRISFVIHSMPWEVGSSLMRIYKRLSLTALRFLLRAPGRRAIFMNSAALESAVNKGIDRKQCVLGGWGYDMLPSDLVFVERPKGDQTIILAFGVLRKDKRIDQLVDLFLELDDPQITLRIVGKSLDVDVLYLRRRIIERNSKSKVEILEGYVEEDNIANLFADCHIVVLSHSSGFESMSGPMFLAIQYERPILCFSGHTVASLVQESGAGLVVRLEDDRIAISSAIDRLRNWSYEKSTLQRYTWGAIANRMVKDL
jgi:glycosyltransferase involved in cell wall biosynthesis